MNRVVSIAFFLVSSAALCAQQSTQQNPYQGTSNPPPDDAIVTDQEKPPAAQPAPAQDAAQAPVKMDANTAAPGNSADTLPIPQPQAAPALAPAQPALESREASADPDGDIVHPGSSLRPGELAEGTTIRVKLLNRLSSAELRPGEPFRSQVASDVYQGDKILIPAGVEIDGTVVQVSTGHAGSSGSMRLRPEVAILPDGSRFRIHAELSGTRGSNTHVVGEGTIKPDPRWKRDGVEYGGAVGVGAVTGAFVAGPVGALTGGLIGAGAATAHVMLNHQQATLEPGATLLFTLTEPLEMAPALPTGN